MAPDQRGHLRILRNKGITHLIITGVVTEGCLETTVREAADRSFANVLVEDGCGTYMLEAHQAAFCAMGARHGCVRTTSEVLAKLESLARKRAPHLVAGSS